MAGSDEEPERHRLELSAVEIMASALAAVSGAALSSYFGVGGTVVGAGLMSVVAVVGTAIYRHSMRTAGHRVRQVRPAMRRGPVWVAPTATDGGASPADPDATTVAEGPELPPLAGTDAARASEQERRLLGPLSRARLALATLTVFVLALVGVTAAEFGLGQTLSSWLRGDEASSGTTVDRVFSGGQGRSRPAPTAEDTSSPEPTSEDSEPSPEATPEESPSPEQSPSEPTDRPPDETPPPAESPTAEPLPTPDPGRVTGAAGPIGRRP